MEYVDRALLLHKSLSNQMKFHLQVTEMELQLVKLEKYQCEKSVASLGLDTQSFTQMNKVFQLLPYSVESIQLGNLTSSQVHDF